MGSKLTKQKKKNLEEGKELEKGGGFSSGTWPRNKKPDFSDQKSATLGRGRKGDGANTLERRQSFGKRLRASARNFAANRGFIDPCKSPQACGGHSRSEAPTKPSSVILGENEAKAEAVEEMVVKADEVQENAAHNDVSLVVKELVEEAILKKSREKLNEGDDQKVEAQVEEPVKIEESGLVEIDSNTAITTEVQPAENVSQFLSQKSVCEEDVTPIAEVETNDEIVIATKEDGVEEEEETPCIENLQHAQISLVATTEVAEVLEREETPEVSESAVEDINETPVQVQIEAEEKQESVLLDEDRRESAPVEIETTEAIIEPIKEEKDIVIEEEKLIVQEATLVVGREQICDPICEVAPENSAPESSTPIEIHVQEDTPIVAKPQICDPICEAALESSAPIEIHVQEDTPIVAKPQICDPICEAGPESSAPIEVTDVKEDTLIVAEELVGPPAEEFVAICDPIAEDASNESHEAAPIEVIDVQEDTLIVAKPQICHPICEAAPESSAPIEEKDTLIVAEKLVAPPAEELVMVCDPVAISGVIHEASSESIKQENTIVEKQEEKVVVCSFGSNEESGTVSELIQRETTIVESRQEKVIVCTSTVVEKQEEKIITCHFGSNEPPVQIEKEIETKVVEAEQVVTVEAKAEAEVIHKNETEVVPQSEGEVETVEEVIEKVEEEQSEQPVEEVVTKDIEKVDNAVEQIVTENVDKEVERVDEDVDNMVEQEIKVESIEVVGTALLTEAEKIAKDIIDNVVAEASDESDTEEMVEEVVKEVIEEVVEENEEASELVSESVQAAEEQVQTNEEPIEGNEEPVSAIEAPVQTIDEVNEAAKESVHTDEEEKNVISTDEEEVNPKECESSEAVTENIIELNNVEASKTIDTECASNAVKDTVEEKAADAASDAGSDDGSERTDVSTDEGIAASSDDEKCNEGKDITAKEKVSKNTEDVTQTVETSA